MPCVYLPGPAPAVTVANKYKWYIIYCQHRLPSCVFIHQAYLMLQPDPTGADVYPAKNNDFFFNK